MLTAYATDLTVCNSAAACNIIGLTFQLILKVAKHIYIYSETINSGWKLADGQLLF